MAVVAYCPSGEAAEHIFILNLVAVSLHPFEKLIDAHYRMLVPLNAVSLPDSIFLFFCQIAPRLEYSNMVPVGVFHDLVFEPAHLLPSPARNRPIIDALRLVRYHQILADADDFAKAAAGRAGTQRAVEAEKIFIRLPKRHSVQLEAVGIFLIHYLLAFFPQNELSLPFREGSVDGATKAGLKVIPFSLGPRRAILIIRITALERWQFKPVYEEIQPIRVISSIRKPHYVLDGDHSLAFPCSEEPGIALFFQLQHQLNLIFSIVPVQVRHDVNGAGVAFQDACHHIIYAMALHLLSADWRICTADAGKYDPQVIVNFRRRGNRGTRILDVHFLLYCYRWWNPLDGFHIGLAHPAQELPGIRAQTFREPSLTLCEQGVERQR